MKNANRALYTNNNDVGIMIHMLCFMYILDMIYIPYTYTNIFYLKWNKTQRNSRTKDISRTLNPFFLSARRILVTIMITPITKPALVKPTL